MRLLCYTAAILCAVTSATCQNVSTSSSFTLASTYSSTVAPDSTSPTPEPVPTVTGQTLRLLPLGDSITMGIGSDDGNGYRGFLYDLLKDSNTVNMLGGVESGAMAQPWSDGYSMFLIEGIQAEVTPHLPWAPNLILLCAGMNNLRLNYSDPAGKMQSLINLLTSSLPATTLLVSTVPFSWTPSIEANIEPFNQQLKAMVNASASKGSKIAVVDIWAPFNNVTGIHHDMLHPNTAGYKIMANEWYKGIALAASKNWISTPAVAQQAALVQSSSQSPALQRKLCMTGPPVSWQPQGQLFNGGGLGASLFTGTTCVATPKVSGQCNCNYNDGTKVETSPLVGPNCAAMSTAHTRSIQFADINGDGLADLISIGTKGTASIYAQSAGANSTSMGGFSFLGNATLPVGAHRSQIQFADLSGDGLADMLWIRPNGTVLGYMNAGTSGTKVLFTPKGTLTTGFSGLPGAGVHFWDVDGDGSMDYCYIDANGVVQVAYGTPASGGMQSSWASPVVYSSANLLGRDRAAVGDLQGDGFAEMFNINRVTGDIAYYANTGNGLGTTLKKSATGLFPEGNGVQVVNLGSDLRVDLAYVDPKTSAVSAWRNGCPAVWPGYGPGSPVLSPRGYGV